MGWGCAGHCLLLLPFSLYANLIHIAFQTRTKYLSSKTPLAINTEMWAAVCMHISGGLDLSFFILPNSTSTTLISHPSEVS